MKEVEVLNGLTMQFADAEVSCAFARFAIRTAACGTRWSVPMMPARVRGQFIRQVGECASGRLIAIDKEIGKAIEPTLPP